MKKDQMEIQTASKWYRWLWLSPFLTIPTLLILFSASDALTYSLLCPQGWQNCNYAAAYKLNGLIAVLFSALWHLLLLIPSLNKESQFVCWHGRQAMILAGVRTAVPLIFLLAAGFYFSEIVAFLILIPIWFFGTFWGQRQAARGDCSLMRWTGRGDFLPGPPADGDKAGIEGFSNETLENTFRFSQDPEERQAALEEFKKRGLVENL
jgi:hypothetical protein